MPHVNDGHVAHVHLAGKGSGDQGGAVFLKVFDAVST